jgi:hypothetical protein
LGSAAPQTIYKKQQIGMCDADHISLAEKAAEESMVLLKNDNSTLPIKPSYTKVAVLGATVPYKTTNGGSTNTGGILNFATDVLTGDLGSSRVFPDPAKSVGPFAGIEAAAPSGVTVVNPASADADVPADTDFIVVMAGLTPQDEGEEYTRRAIDSAWRWTRNRTRHIRIFRTTSSPLRPPSESPWWSCSRAAASSTCRPG